MKRSKMIAWILVLVISFQVNVFAEKETAEFFLPHEYSDKYKMDDLFKQQNYYKVKYQGEVDTAEVEKYVNALVDTDLYEVTYIKEGSSYCNWYLLYKGTKSPDYLEDSTKDFEYHIQVSNFLGWYEVYFPQNFLPVCFEDMDYLDMLGVVNRSSGSRPATNDKDNSDGSSGNHESSNHCALCRGTGKMTCTTCHGDGIVNDNSESEKRCWTCHGDGKVTCRSCNGTGTY